MIVANTCSGRFPGQQIIPFRIQRLCQISSKKKNGGVALADV